jgi:hypothetical protein
MSGPSGKVVGSKFVFDEMRNRFVYPHDKSLIVYFEWQASPGNHTLTGLWKDPQGRTAFISSDLKMETATSELNAYWTYEISPGVSGGIWTLEVRIDGEPAGSHSFELVVPEEPKPSAQPAPPSQPKLPSLDELYRSAIRSLVWVHKLDEAGRRTDTASGFVIGWNQVTTAFQAIDTAVRIEIEFTSDRRVTTDELWTCQRLEDWALIKVDTGETPALPRGDPDAVPIGERLVVFNVEAGLARAIGGVDVSGRRKVPALNGYRFLRLSPPRQSEDH